GAKTIMFEFAAGSLQTFIGLEFARAAARQILEEVPDCRIVLASHVPGGVADPRGVHGTGLFFRETVELTRYSSLWLGCSSGISWLCTSSSARRLPTIQLLSRKTSVFASMVHDHEYFGLETDSIIEMTDCAVERVVGCVRTVFGEGFQA